MKKLVSFALLFFSLTSYGQWKNTSTVIPSPNAAALGVFTENPVSYFTGTPDITIPVYEIKGTRLTVPLSLSYHVGSIRPDAHPGWTGIGWNIFAGGAITRKLNKIPDEMQATSIGNKGYYFKYNNLGNGSTWSSTLNDFDKYPIDTDAEPDEFSFNFLGYSGKFFLDHTGQWQVQSDMNLKVMFDPSDFAYPFIYNSSYVATTQQYVTKTFRKFTILDEKGNKYVFGETDSSIEYSDEIAPPTGRRGELFFATSWHLSKIESADGLEVIQFNYVRGPFTSYLYKQSSTSHVNSSGGTFLEPSCNSTNSSIKTNGRVISPVYLSSIQFPKQSLLINFNASKSNDLTYSDTDYGRVIFDNYLSYSDDDYKILSHTSGLYFDNSSDAQADPIFRRFISRKLNSISIINSSTNEQIKKISLNYLEEATRRLRLSSVDFKDKSDQAVQHYSFNYNDDVLLPAYLTKIGDHWGYNNNQSLPNTFSADFFNLREPNEYYTKAEVLKEIFYPTGGSTEFEFEINKYSGFVTLDRQDITSENGTAGGLRIKRVINKDAVRGSTTKEYFYVNDYAPNVAVSSLSSSGILDAKPKYTFSNFSGTDISGNSFTQQFTSSNPVIPLTSSSRGTYIGYSEVVEKYEDGGYTKYKFTNHGTAYRDGAPAIFNLNNVAYYPSSSRDFERGRLLSKHDYKNTGKLLREVINEYSRINPDQKSARAVSNIFLKICESAGAQAVSRSAYLLYYYPFALTRQLVNEYSSDDASNAFNSTEKTYVIDDYKNIVEEKTSFNAGSQLKSISKYAYDFATGGSSNPYNQMLNKHMVADAVEKRSFRIKSGVEYLTAAELSKFKIHTNDHPVKEILYKFRTDGLVNPASLSASTYSSGLVFDQNFLPEIRYTYDSDGNIITIQKENDLPLSLAYSNSSFLPIAEAKNSDQSFNYSAFDFQSARDLSFNSAGVSEDASAPMGTKCYNLSFGTLSSVAPEAGKTWKISYWYKSGASITVGGSAIFSNIISGPTRNGWTYTERQVNGEDVSLSGTGLIDEVRVYPANAELTTYAYQLLTGLTAVCDINSRITYYEYDAFGRLSIIKDADRNIIRKICYNYAGQLENCGQGGVYSNTAVSNNYLSQNCLTGSTPVPYAINIPAGTFVSSSSQTEADAQAQQHAQNLANQFGLCMWSSAAVSGPYYRQNCTPGSTALAYPVNIAAGAFTSTISQADANGKAQVQAQNLANLSGICMWSSDAVSGNYYKQTCSTGSTALAYAVSISAGAYTSTISKSDANSKAQVQAQNLANQNGLCLWGSDQINAYYYSQNCPSGSTGAGHWIHLGTGAYTSTISKADADAKAQLSAQTWVNQNGLCMWPNDITIDGYYYSQSCPEGMSSNAYYVYIAPGEVYSYISQADANAQAQAYAQEQANQNGGCYWIWSNENQSGWYFPENCPGGQYYYIYANAGWFTSYDSQADANAVARQYAQDQANQRAITDGLCAAPMVLFYIHKTGICCNIYNRNWRVTFTDINTGQSYDYATDNASQTLIEIPIGTYNVHVYNSDGYYLPQTWFAIYNGTYLFSQGATADYYEVYIGSGGGYVSINNNNN